MISQREVGEDTQSYSTALRHVLRQDPDVILLGEIRDRESMEIALQASDTGHLVFSTLHTADTTQSIGRIISFFPPHQHQEIRLLTASTLQSIISMRLLPRMDEKGRVPACEVLINTEAVKDCIIDPLKTYSIPNLIREGFAKYGMQSFDQSLMRLYRSGFISYEEALYNSTNPTEFSLRVKGIKATSDTAWDDFDAEPAEHVEEVERETERDV
jgi:twitching motility protein PilT